MAKNDGKGKTKTPADRSPKAHMPLPERSIEPTGETQEDQRGEVGQFTDRGAPGLQKK